MTGSAVVCLFFCALQAYIKAFNLSLPIFNNSNIDRQTLIKYAKASQADDVIIASLLPTLYSPSERNVSHTGKGDHSPRVAQNVC